MKYSFGRSLNNQNMSQFGNRDILKHVRFSQIHFQTFHGICIYGATKIKAI